MIPTADQLQALGLTLPPDPDAAIRAAQPSPMPTIMPAPTQYPRSIMGSQIPTGAQIPTSHAQGKEEFQEFMPQITASPGTADYFRQRQEQLDYKAQHPWGAPISAHPGLGGKILHGLSEAGQIAGAAFGPTAAIEAATPGSILHNAMERNQNERGILAGEQEENQASEAQSRATSAAAEKERSDTEAENADKEQAPKPLFDENGDLIGFQHEGDLIGLHNPKLTPDMRDLAATVQPKQAKPVAPKVNYDSGIPVSVTDGKGNTYDVNDPKLPPELKPLVQSASKAHSQHVTEETNKQAAAFGQQEKMFEQRQEAPTTQMRNVAAQSQIALGGIPDTIKEIQTLKDDLGPVAGRWNDFMQGKVGTDNPKFAGLRADLLMLSSAVALAHARGRLPENLREEFDSAINAPKQSAENLVSTLEHMQTWLQKSATMGQTETTKSGTHADPLGIR